MRVLIIVAAAATIALFAVRPAQSQAVPDLNGRPGVSWDRAAGGKSVREGRAGSGFHAMRSKRTGHAAKTRQRMVDVFAGGKVQLHRSGRLRERQGRMATHKTDEQIEELVRVFLKRIGLEYQVCPDLMTVIVKIKHIDGRFNYGRVPDQKLPACEAEWDSTKTLVRMRESIFVGMQRNEPRARMTVAHELAHYLHGHKGFLYRKPGIRSSDIAIASIRHEESEARRTGPIILAPEHLISKQTNPEEISSMFLLSAEAAYYRYEEVQRIRRRREGVQRPLPQSIVDYLREAKRRGYVLRTHIDELKE